MHTLIHDLLQGLPEPGLRADVCVVGAGAAGIALALELVRLGKTVTLLEGGGTGIEEESQDPYRSEIVGLRHHGIHTGRFRAQGGTTTRWGGQILPLAELDFEPRSWVPGSGWPLRRAELEPYYERALELEGLGGVRRSDEEVWAALRLGVPEYPELLTYFSRWCPEPRFAVLHGEALATNPALGVWLHANAVELMLDAEQVVGVRCRTLTGREAIFRADEYVFALGAIESSRFFLQPRAGGLPWNRSGLLGRNFQDHVDANIATVTPTDPGRFHALFDNVFLNGYKYQPKLRLTPEVQAKQRLLSAAVSWYFESPLEETLGSLKTTAKRLLRGRFGEIAPADVASMVANLPLLARQTYRYSAQHRAYNPPGAIRLRVHCEQEPLSGSSITLAEERDGLGLLRTRLDWRISETELHTIRAILAISQRAFAPVARLEADPALVAKDPAFLANCYDTNHHMGGMRMAESDAEGVVAPDLRLHGTRNAFVCSSAVFPTSGNSNPTHTLLALAVRLAERLAAG